MLGKVGTPSVGTSPLALDKPPGMPQSLNNAEIPISKELSPNESKLSSSGNSDINCQSNFVGDQTPNQEKL